MKRIIVLLIPVLVTTTLTAQDFVGQWNGVLKLQGTTLRLIFSVTKTENAFSAIMDSPDQGVNGIPVTNTTFENPKIKFEVANAGIVYEGQLKGDEIIGVFKQGGQEFTMNLSRKIINKKKIKRPQEPIKPYPYYSEDVVFKNEKANISLSGTLTLPNKNGVFPVVILITGSGPQNRDGELFEHKPFLIISDYLTRNGVAVLRYDDRGVGESTGDFKTATTADFSTDVESAITYLKTRKEIEKHKIGLIGHSEGGLIASIVASTSRDVSFVVLLAGTGIQGHKLLLLQQELITKAHGGREKDINESIKVNYQLFEMVVKSNSNSKLKEDLTEVLNDILDKKADTGIPSGMSKKKFITMKVNQISSPWMVYFMKFDPVTALEKVTCPVLAINGEKDLQVPAKANLPVIKSALIKGGNLNVTIKEFPNLNHLFQECETGSPNAYVTIEQTFSPKVLAEITKWINTRTE